MYVSRVPVGVVWLDLNKPHYGIHGTSEPQTIGYAASNGCVRLTNWDVEFLSHHVRAGVPVEFRDISGQKQAEDPANATAAATPATSSGGGRAAAATGSGSGNGRSSSTPAASPSRRSGTSGSSSASEGRTNRTRTEPSQPRQPEKSSTETPKATEPPRQEDHSGHTPGR